MKNQWIADQRELYYNDWEILRKRFGDKAVGLYRYICKNRSLSIRCAAEGRKKVGTAYRRSGESELVKARIEQLEERLNMMEKKVKKLETQNQKLKSDLTFFENMLWEEYQLLLRLLGEENLKLNLH